MITRVPVCVNREGGGAGREVIVNTHHVFAADT